MLEVRSLEEENHSGRSGSRKMNDKNRESTPKRVNDEAVPARDIACYTLSRYRK
jgi:hypothetical protein